MSKLKHKVGDKFKRNQNDVIITITDDSEGNYQFISNIDDDFDYMSESHLNAYYTKIEEIKQVGGSHYSKLKIDPYEYSMVNDLNPLQMNAIKYVTRYNFKNGIEDLEKAIHTINRLIEFEKNKL